jgi:hypothetical protein
MNVFQYLQASMSQLIKFIQNDSTPKSIKYEIKCICDKKLADFSTWLEYLTNTEMMNELIEEGKTYAELFLNYEKELSQSAT